MEIRNILKDMLNKSAEEYLSLQKTGDLTQTKRIRLGERIKTLKEILIKI